MELEELKKSWNALDEHLKDKELIKEEELSKLLGHTGKGIHAIANLNIKLILISLPILILVPGGSPVAQQAEPYLYHYPSSLDSRTLLGYRHYPLPPTDPNRRNAFDRSNQPCQPHPPMDHQRASVCHLFPSGIGCSFIHLLASMAIRYRHDFLFCPVMGRRSRTDLMDLPQEVPKPYPRNQKESERIKRIQIIKRKECAYPTTLSTLFPFTFLCTCT